MAPAQQREVRITSQRRLTVVWFQRLQPACRCVCAGNSELRFTQMASTKMACVPPFMELESQVLKMLATLRPTASKANNDSPRGDQVLARFEAVYLR